MVAAGPKRIGLPEDLVFRIVERMPWYGVTVHVLERKVDHETRIADLNDLDEAIVIASRYYECGKEPVAPEAFYDACATLCLRLVVREDDRLNERINFLCREPSLNPRHLMYAMEYRRAWMLQKSHMTLESDAPLYRESGLRAVNVALIVNYVIMLKLLLNQTPHDEADRRTRQYYGDWLQEAGIMPDDYLKLVANL